MKLRSLYFFAGILVLVSLFATPSSAFAWTNTPQKITFVNEQGITLTGWLFTPAGSGPFPAVVMMHGCPGMYSYSDPTRGISTLYREWGDRLVSAGYVGLLVDSFTPRNATQNQCGNGSVGVSEVNDRPYDAFAALKYLASNSYVSANRIGLLGWSHGGSSAIAAMDSTKFNISNSFKAAVTFYPGCGLYDAFGGVNNSTWKPYAPFMILHDSADTVVSPAYCQTRVSKAQTLGAANISITIFANAKHSFDGARSVANSFTQADVDAKKSADTQAMQFFAAYLR
ncbi:MAG: dienelactone hydrolase family protein [Chloroflexota bacterium]